MKSKFFKYASIGVINTTIHWITFTIMFTKMDKNQAYSNFIAFCVAVSFSFYANSKITFKATVTTTRYIMYVSFMGVLSILTGYAADKCHLQPILTLLSFSIISLTCGYIYSKYIVFKGVA